MRVCRQERSGCRQSESRLLCCDANGRLSLICACDYNFGDVGVWGGDGMVRAYRQEGQFCCDQEWPSFKVA